MEYSLDLNSKKVKKLQKKKKSNCTTKSVETEVNAFKISLQSVDSNLHNNFSIYVNGTDLKLLNLFHGDFVVFQNEDNSQLPLVKFSKEVKSLDLNSSFFVKTYPDAPSLNGHLPVLDDLNVQTFVKHYFRNLGYVLNQTIFEVSYFGKSVKLVASLHLDDQDFNLDCLYELNANINIKFVSTKNTRNKVKKKKLAFGGLVEEFRLCKEMVELALINPFKFQEFGLRPPRGILLYGPPGTGKTLIANVISEECNANLIKLSGPDILGKFYGESEEKLRAAFKDACINAPSIILIDEIDILCPKRENANHETQKRVVATLLTLMDGASDTSTQNQNFVILATTNRPEDLDDALRRPGRFDREIEIGIPNPSSRLQILQSHLNHIPNNLCSQDLESFSESMHGYVGADIASLAREAGLHAIKKFLEVHPGGDFRGSDLKLTSSDLKFGIKRVKPSALREIMLEVPKVFWEDIGGQHEVKQRLRETIEWPMKNPASFKKFNIKPPKGILLYGPPGCSKTLMAKALATESGLNFIAVKGPEDEIDALAITRGAGSDGGVSVNDRVLSQLLTELDGIDILLKVIVVAATNRPDVIDPALLRPGRIDRLLYVGPPDCDSIIEILKIKLRKMSCDVDVSAEKLASKLAGYSGAEIVSLCQEAGLVAMEEDNNALKISMKHFSLAIKRFTPRINKEMIRFYEEFSGKFD
ncbi:spermatogenesis associated protein 5 [Clydaea vesicula]|uniref:Spermatogenesis associated protein 5 n=1 Tax=Clydaea vesicula TaxID=447962 RepID=A0AAD5XZM5_9FUNG|nr:spermatogenesis associated protein 5 [Clydaea vesicula]